MTPKRILLLGVTGTDKPGVIEQFRKWCSQLESAVTVRGIDFEAEFLGAERDGDLDQFLDDSAKHQITDWRAAWSSFKRSFAPKPGRPPEDDAWPEAVQWDADMVLLSLHACYTRRHYGVRVIFDPGLLKEFRPHAVVTLLDDVYDMWWRTEKRAKGEAWRGRPTLEHLLTARRVEEAVGSQIARLSDPAVPHWLLAVQHPCETLFRLVQSRPLTVYLSFPISRPRELEAAGDAGGIAEINAFLKKAYEAQQAKKHVVFLNPLAIDERPLVDKALPDKSNRMAVDDPERQRSYTGIVFDREGLRWDLSAFCDVGGLLSPGPVPVAQRLPLDEEQVEQSSGLIKTDVGWRDYGLAAQVKRLAVFNPVFGGANRPARGVRGEIETAWLNQVKVYCYQSGDHDPHGKFEQWVGDGGSTGPSGVKGLIVRCASVEELIDRVTTP